MLTRSRTLVSRGIAATYLAGSLIWLHYGAVYAASNAAQPVLKAIDPSAAKLDAPPPPEASNDPGRKFNQKNPFNSNIQGRPLGSPAPSSGNTAAAGSVTPSPAPGMLVPQLDQPVETPQSQGQFAAQPATQSFGQVAPAASAVDEQRVTRLEKQAFGNTYPEHEVDDRLEHLEKEVLGGKMGGQTIERIARLEQKLLGGSGFGTASSAPIITPVSAANYPAPVAVAPPHFAPLQQTSPAQTPFITSPRQISAPQTSPPQNSPLQTSPQQFQPLAQKPAHPATHPQIPSNHLPPGQVAVPSAWNNQPNFSPRAYVQPQAPQNSGMQARPSALSVDANAVASSLSFDAKAGDYVNSIRRFGGANGAAVAHWQQFPVKVRLPSGSPESWQRNLESVIARWDQYVPVKIALPSEPSNVDVLWVNQLPPKALGVTRLNIVNGQMQVWVYLLRPSFYPADVPERTLAGVFTREVGHALGLFGKSDKPSDLMYASENGSSNISASSPAAGKKALIKLSGIGPRDINTLKRLYESPATPPGFALGQPLEWATNY